MPFEKKIVIVDSVVNATASFKSQLDTWEEEKCLKIWLSDLTDQAALAFVEEFKIMPFHILTAAKWMLW